MLHLPLLVEKKNAVAKNRLYSATHLKAGIVEVATLMAMDLVPLDVQESRKAKAGRIH